MFEDNMYELGKIIVELIFKSRERDIKPEEK